METEPEQGDTDPTNVRPSVYNKATSPTGPLVQAAKIIGNVHLHGGQHAQLSTDPVPVRRTLRADIRHFINRRKELADLKRNIYPQAAQDTHATIFVINGMGGVGKTAFAFHAAWQLARQFADIHLEVDLRGFAAEDQRPADPSVVLCDFLQMLGVPREHIPTRIDARASLYRDRVSELRALIVLDNAADESQVRPLLPAGPHCLVLITSRQAMVGLEGAINVHLTEFSQSESLDLFTQIVGNERVNAEPESAVEICQMIGGLAIALSVAAARIRSRPAWRLQDYIERLKSRNRLLHELKAGDRSVTAVFDLSYHPLPDTHRQVFRWFVLHPGQDAAAQSVAALCDISPESADRILDDLLDYFLVRQSTPGRYRMHDLVHAYAQQRLDIEDSSDSRHDAIGRVVNWYLHAARTATQLIAPDRSLPEVQPDALPQYPLQVSDHRHALNWFEDERHNLASTVAVAKSEGFHTIAWQLAQTLFSFYSLRRYDDDWVTTCQIGLESARRSNDVRAQAIILNQLGSAYGETRSFDRAIECYQKALSLRRESADRKGEASVLNNLGSTYDDMQRFEEAIECYQQALPIRREVGDKYGEGNTLNNLGESYRSSLRFNEAIECYRQALPLRREVDDRLGEATTINNIGKTYLAIDDVAQALPLLRQALAIRRDIGDRWGTARTLIHLGRILRINGDLEGARKAWGEALETFERLNDPRAAVVRDHLSRLPSVE